MAGTTFLTKLRRRRKVRSPIGIDFGSCGVRAAQVTRVGRGWIVNGAVAIERPQDNTTGSVLVPSVDELEYCVDVGSFGGSSAWAALGTPEVEFVSLELPESLLTKGGVDLDRAAGFEMQRLMSAGKEAVETRYWQLPPTRVPGPNALGVLTTRPLVEKLIAVARETGLQCLGVDTSANALCRFGLAIRDWPADAVWAVLDVGHRQTRLIVCADRTPLLVRAAGTGGQSWTTRIAEALSVSTKAAEVLKRDYGLSSNSDEGSPECPSSEPRVARPGDHANSELGSVLRGILRSDLNDLAAEIKRSYEYALSCYPTRRAADLVLVGSGAGLGGLSEFLRGLLGIQVDTASAYLARPECRLGCPAAVTKQVETFATAIGVVMDDDDGGDLA